MQNPTITVYSQPGLEEILNSNEQILWSGEPTYGRRIFQVLSQERLWHFGFAFGIAAMWSTLPFIRTETGQAPIAAVWVYAITTIAFIFISAFIAIQRQHVLSSLVYIITNKRAIVCRSGKNWFFSNRLYVVSCPHSETYPYEVTSSRPYPSLQIGTLLSDDQLQPFGFGLAHPGQPVLRGRVSAPVMFEYVPNAQELFDMIMSCARQTENNAG